MSGKQFSILVVEDEPDGQELVSRMLSQSNVAVDVAGNVGPASPRDVTTCSGFAVPGDWSVNR